MSTKTRDTKKDVWICQECGEVMASYIEDKDLICECPSCGFTVIRKRYE